MKKTLLSALFCGFVLNNGYCFDEEHKITEEYLNESIFREERVPDLEQSGNSADQLSRDDHRRAGVVLGVDTILRNACKFAVEFLKTVIPSGNDKGKQVRELLRERRLNNDHMQMICDDSVKYHLANSGNYVSFRVDDGIMGVYLNLNKMVEFAFLYIPLLGFLDSVELRQYEPLTSL